jgi:hypothetical protein
VHRKGLLNLPHIAPLSHFAATLRAQDRGEVPEFDPLDGGVDAKALFLFEKPGPMTDATKTGKRSGSGVISRDNDDPTAEATFRFMQDAGIPRKLTITWNVIPWWNGTRRISGAELREGVDALDPASAGTQGDCAGRPQGRARPSASGGHGRSPGRVRSSFTAGPCIATGDVEIHSEPVG